MTEDEIKEFAKLRIANVIKESGRKMSTYREKQIIKKTQIT